MDDLISRQATIERIRSLYPRPPFLRMNRKRWEKEYKPYIEVEKELEKLPSAQPEIIRCKDCIHWKHSDARKSYCDVFDWMSKEDDFCSFAERRTDE